MAIANTPVSEFPPEGNASLRPSVELAEDRGAALRAASCGDVLSGSTPQRIVYTGIPSEQRLCTLEVGTLVISDRKGSVLAALSNANQCRLGAAEKWVADLRQPGLRMYTKCCRAGSAPKSRGGHSSYYSAPSRHVLGSYVCGLIRSRRSRRPSRKCNCSARISWKARSATELSASLSDSDFLKLQGLTAMSWAQGETPNAPCSLVWEAIAVNMGHTNHDVLVKPLCAPVCFKSRCPELTSALQEFRQNAPANRSRGMEHNATLFLKEKFPERQYAPGVVKNAISNMRRTRSPGSDADAISQRWRKRVCRVPADLHHSDERPPSATPAPSVLPARSFVGFEPKFACLFCEKISPQVVAPNAKQHMTAVHATELKKFLEQACKGHTSEESREHALTSAMEDYGRQYAERLAKHPKRGDRIEVLHQLEAESGADGVVDDWFIGTVVRSGRCHVDRITKVLYDHGERLEHNFTHSSEKWRMLQ